MNERYHHGSLRDALMAEGRRALVAEGVEAVTLRGLAREIGVSHAAPSRHFADREALLEAIAAQGFDELTEAALQAASSDTITSRLQLYGRALVGFAVANGPLIGLMFTLKQSAPDGPLALAAHRFFDTGALLLGRRPDEPATAVTYLLVATFEGISGLVNAGRMPADTIDDVVDAAASALAPLVTPSAQ